VEPGRIVRTFTQGEASALADAWLDVFGQDSAGANTRDYLWHVFSGRRYPALDLAAAHDAYKQETCADYVVLSNDRDEAFVTDLRPTATPMHDWLVFPSNFAWTMVFTHEAGWLGPYFAKHPDYVRLKAAEASRLKKLQEIAQAREHGWT
jgi:hypothetical protein